MRTLMRAYRDEHHAPLAMMCKALVSKQATVGEVERCLNSIVSADIEACGLTAYVARRAYKSTKKRTSIASDHDPDPKTMIDALLSNRAEEWCASIYKEFNGLV